MKKELLLIIPNLDFGGAQRSISSLSSVLSEHFNVTLVVFKDSGKVDFKYKGELLSLEVPAGQHILQKIANFFLRCHRLKKIKKQKNVFCSISYLEGANFVNILSKRATENVIVSVRGSQRHDETIKGILGKMRLELLIPFLYRYSDIIVALNQGIVEELRMYGTLKKHRIIEIGNFYDINEIDKDANEELAEPFQFIFKKPVIISAGRLAPEKGYQHFLEVYAALLKTKKSSAHLVILGDGLFREDLVQKAKELNLSYFASWETPLDKIEAYVEPTVFLLGFQVNPYQFLKKATVFVLTSSSEGGPNILSEAMICNVPVVSVDCPSGPREKLSIEDRPELAISKAEFANYGILMPMLNNKTNKNESINEWVIVLIKLLGDVNIRNTYVTCGRSKMEQYGKEIIVQRWLNIILKQG